MATALRDHSIFGKVIDRRDWSKGMSDNVASALLIYTGLNVLVTIHGMRKLGAGLWLANLAFIVLVVAIIPACRRLDRRWKSVGKRDVQNPGLVRRYRRDQLLLWLLALGLPFAITSLLLAIARLL